MLYGRQINRRTREQPVRDGDVVLRVALGLHQVNENFFEFSLANAVSMGQV